MDFPVNHDIHLHTGLSVCSGDKEMTPENILRFAEERGYDTLCLTDHYWDSAVPNPSDFYAVQDLEHVKGSYPLPKTDKLRLLFGCETEYCGGERIAITKATMDEFAFIAVPLNHFHMPGLTRDPSINTPAAVAELFMERIEQLAQLDLPFSKIGLAHLNCSLIYKAGDWHEVMRLLDHERLEKAFRIYAKKGAGIELNASCFGPGWLDHEDENLEIFRTAKRAGCKFYCASDAHHLPGLSDVPNNLPLVAEKLGLTAEDRYMIP